MTREIKFRAWDGSRMCAVTQLEFGINDGIIMGSFGWYGGMVGAVGVKIMQYTGLKDKNGKEIYEGDIVNVEPFTKTGRIEVVGWYAPIMGSITLHPFQGDAYHWLSQDCEVIGNIYENPELLKTEDNG